MPAGLPASPPIVGSCRGCGYALQGLTSNRCPECGREFDPNNPKTMNMGCRAGAIARFLSRPIRWTWVLAILFLATASVVLTSRPQIGSWKGWDLTPADLKLYVVWAGRQPKILLTWVDQLYAAGIWLWIVVAGWIVLRSLLGLAARWRFHIVVAPAAHRTRIFFTAMLFLLITSLGVMIGWPFRLGQHVAADYVNEARNVKGQVALYGVIAYFPGKDGNPEREQRIAWAAMRQSPRAEQRLAGLGMVYRHGSVMSVAAMVKDAIAAEDDPAVLEWEIRVLGMTHDRELIDIVDRFLQSPDARLRIAALDAITESADPRFDSKMLMVDDNMLMASATPIPVREKEYSAHESWDPPGSVQYSLVTAARVTNIATTSADLREREAAAWAMRSLNRTLETTGADPTSGFRVAEWGVWVDNGWLDCAREVLGDIPPFVHRYGDKAATLATELPTGPWMVTKPVMHFYVDRPTVVAIDLQIQSGRINYVYPKADDYVLGAAYSSSQRTTTVPSPLAPFDPKASLPPFSDRRRPFEWLVPDPSNPFLSGMGGRGWGVLVSVGFRYDALLVTPQQQAWMQPPIVGADPKFAWWARLREVPSAWVSSRGESERFLYYDGPTQLTPNVRIKSPDPQHLTIESLLNIGDVGSRIDSSDSIFVTGMKQTARGRRRGERRGMYIHVADGKASGEIVPVPQGTQNPKDPAHTIGSGQQLANEQLEAALRAWIIDAGLTDAEATGLLMCWRDTFFQKPGRRFVMLMSAVDYDSLCPMVILPYPQTVARVGLVWTELNAQAPAAQPK